MSRSIRVAGRMVELVGLDQVWLGFDHLCNSKLTLYYPKAPVQTIEYKCGEWAQAANDKKIIEEALRPSNLNVASEPLLDNSATRKLLR
jgi:hypothetical protein